MADIRLAKPAPGASQSIPCEPEARFVFDFPTTDATLARDGDNLNIRFEDGSNLELQGFYQEYNEENLPSFSIDGTEVAAADFFAAMNEPDLMPAAGPGTGTVANGARFHEWGDSALTGGIQHLNGLDWGFSRSFEWEDHPNAVGYTHDDDGGNNPVTLTPEDPTPVPPGTPGIPGIPDGGDPGNAGIVPPGDVRLVSEGGLRDGDSVSVNGAMHVSAPDGLASIEIAGQVIWQNGQMVGKPEFHTDEGYFHNFAYDPATGRLTYTYTLTEATQEHGQPGQDHIAHSLSVTVRDTDGDAASSSITIIIRDDVPEIARPELADGNAAVYEKDTGNAVENAVQDTAKTITLDLKGLTLGADDGDGQSVPEALSVEVGGYTFTFAVTTDADGNYSFEKQTGPGGSAMEITGNRADGYQLVYTRPESDVQSKEAGADTKAKSDTYTFNITVKDADGDIAQTSQTVQTNVTPDVGRVPGGPEPTGPVLDVSEVTVDEAGLSFGTAENSSPATATGAFTVSTHGEGGVLVLSFTAKDGTVSEITIDLDADDNGRVRGEATTISTAYGDLTVTGVTGGTVHYTYTLNSELEHPAPGEGAVRDTAYDVETVKITLTDNIGHDVKEGTLGVNIVDDVPEIDTPMLVAGKDAVREQDTGNVVENTVQDTAETITLSLDGLKFGADDGDGATLTVEVGDYTFTFAVTTDADGNYTFNPRDTQERLDDGSAMEITGNRADGYQLVYTRPESDVQRGGVEGKTDEYTFNITVKDADGDIAATSQTVQTNVTPDVGRVPGAPDSGLDVSEVTVNEGMLDGGTHPEGAEFTASANGSFTVSTHGEGGTLVLSFPALEEGKEA
ncbi:MAG: hypothetical protein HDQ89_11285, partial [Desulfovibrio sp.]|nr:hypothetical protein [Desulfovibrio sp.]